MISQGELFHSPSQIVTPHKDRLEPHVWVRRLVIWEENGKVIREIPFRRGLNIIWSPDPGAENAKLGESTGSGHGAGKTLLCRLLRYCLGEERYANDELRQAITQNLESGLVGAEIMIKGTLWGVVRPIGTTRKHWAVEDCIPEDILEQDLPATGINPLLEAIANPLISDDLERALPGSSDNKGWPYALGWLSRDQECRFDDLLDWRHADAGSRSPLRDISKDETLLVARLFLKLISSKEMDVRKKRDALPKKTDLEQDIAFHSKTIDRLGSDLAEALEVTPIAPATDPLGAGALHNTAKQILENIEKDGVPNGQTDELNSLRQELDGVIGQAAVLKEQIEKTKGLIGVQSSNLSSLKGEDQKLDGKALKAELGDFCPICSVPIDKALAEGCGLSHQLMNVEKIEGDKDRNKRLSDQCSAAIVLYENQQREKEQLLIQAENQMATLQSKIEAIRRTNRKARENYLGRRFNARSIVRSGEKLTAFIEAKAELHKKLDKRNRDSENYAKKLEKLREQHRDAMSKFNELFNYVSKGFLGADTTAQINLTGKGLEAKVQVGGLAMASLKAVVFDLAALLLSIEGRSHLPAFLIHDSPREADLGLSFYHRLFRFVRELENVSSNSQPTFQYFITTTTEPPKEMVSGKCLVATLNGSDPEKRLLKQNF